MEVVGNGFPGLGLKAGILWLDMTEGLVSESGLETRNPDQIELEKHLESFG